MSNISGNQLNNNSSNILNVSGQNVNVLPSSATIFVNAYNTDSISSAHLVKQRKKRKKKKDSNKLLLTNTQTTIGTPTICSSDERRLNNINNSSHLNCASNACACCRFKHSTLFDGNFYAQTEAHNEYDIANKFAGPNNKSINFWTDEIESDDVNCLADRRQFIRAQRNDVTRHNDQLQRFAIYENLCEFCGFAIGNGLHHSNCVPKICENQLNNNNYNEKNNDENCKKQTENIYENICEKCHSIFNGEKCLSELCANAVGLSVENKTETVEVIDILVKKPPVVHRQFGKQFTEFLGSFKQKLNPKPSEIERKRPHIEIIHNVDDAFKTNKTFDLNEIVQLKNAKITTNGYGKLRNRSDERLIQKACNPNPQRKNNNLIRTSISDSNFFDNYYLSGSSHLQSPFSESVVSDTILYSNSYAPPSYEDAIQDKYASVNPFKLKAYTKPTTTSTYDSTSASSFFTYDSSSVSTLQSISLEPKSPADSTLLSNDDALKYWVTSLKQQTLDYGDDNRQFDCDSIKCIPPKMFSEKTIDASLSINSINRNDPSNPTIIQLNETEQTHLRCRVESFKTDLLRRLSKRNAIYIDDSHCINPIGYCTVNGDSGINENSHVEIATISQQVSPVQSVNHTFELGATARYFQMLKSFYMTQIALSTGVNRITLVCGNRNVHFLIKILLNQTNSCEFGAVQSYSNRIVRPTEYINFEQIIEIIQRIGIRKQLSEYDKEPKIYRKTKKRTGNVGKMRPVMVSIEDFVRQSTNHLLEIPLNATKCSIDDFAKEKHKTSADSCNDTKTLDDFHKLVGRKLSICEKTINDFALKKTHYSSQHTSQSSQDVSKQTTEMNETPKNEENIYQPIWMFKTIGTATDTSYDVESLNSSNIGSTEYDEIKIHDGSDWEGAEGEFLFSSNRNGTIKLLNSMPVISHNLNAESKIQLLKRYPNSVDFYETVSILYNNEIEPKLKNKIIYDYNANTLTVGRAKRYTNEIVPTNKSNEADYYCTHMTSNRSRSNELITDGGQAFIPINQNDIKIDSTNSWKSMLRTVDYIDDEEDMVSELNVVFYSFFFFKYHFQFFNFVNAMNVIAINFNE